MSKFITGEKGALVMENAYHGIRARVISRLPSYQKA
jgi:hypothetical protein